MLKERIYTNLELTRRAEVLDGLMQPHRRVPFADTSLKKNSPRARAPTQRLFSESPRRRYHSAHGDRRPGVVPRLRSADPACRSWTASDELQVLRAQRQATARRLDSRDERGRISREFYRGLAERALANRTVVRLRRSRRNPTIPGAHGDVSSIT